MSIDFVDQDQFEQDFKDLIKKARWLSMHVGKPYSLEESAYISLYHYMLQAEKALKAAEG